MFRFALFLTFHRLQALALLKFPLGHGKAMQSSAALHRNAFYSSAVQQTVTQLWEQAKFPYQKTNYNGAQFWSSKTFFFPKQWATILPGLMIHKAWSTELLPLESNLWKTQTHIPFGQFQTEKKKLKNGYRQFIPRPGLCWGRDLKKCKQFPVNSIVQEDECQRGSNFAVSPLYTSLCQLRLSLNLLLQFNAWWADFMLASSYLSWTSSFLALASTALKQTNKNITHHHPEKTNTDLKHSRA